MASQMEKDRRNIAYGFAVLFVFTLVYFTIVQPRLLNAFILSALTLLGTIILALLGASIKINNGKDSNGNGNSGPGDLGRSIASRIGRVVGNNESEDEAPPTDGLRRQRWLHPHHHHGVVQRA